MKTRFTLLFMLLVGMMASVQAQFKLASLVSDGMVLQQQTQVRLWGTATPGQQVSVTASWSTKAKATAQVGADGRCRKNCRDGRRRQHMPGGNPAQQRLHLLMHGKCTPFCYEFKTKRIQSVTTNYKYNTQVFALCQPPGRSF